MIKTSVEATDFPALKMYFEMKSIVKDFKYDTIKKEGENLLVVDNLKFTSEDDELNIKTGDKIPIKFEYGEEGFETYYIANKLRYLEGSNLFLAVEEDINDVLEFAAHTVHTVNRYVISYNAYLINCYFSPDYEYIYFKYRWFPQKEYDDLIKSLKNNKKLNKNLVEYFKDKDDRFDIFKYAIPYIYKKDIKRLIKGQYESFTDVFKDSLYRFCGKEIESQYYKWLFNHDPFLEKRKCLELGLSEWLTKDDGTPLPLRAMPNLQYYE